MLLPTQLRTIPCRLLKDTVWILALQGSSRDKPIYAKMIKCERCFGSEKRHWDPAGIWTWVFWMPVRCSYQLSHWSSACHWSRSRIDSIYRVQFTGWISLVKALLSGPGKLLQLPILLLSTIKNFWLKCTRINLTEGKIQKFPGGYAPRPS